MESNPTAPATAEPAAPVPAVIPEKPAGIDLWGPSVEQYWTSIRPDTPNERLRLFNALDGDSDGFVKALNQPFVLQHVVLAPRQLTTKEGELVDGIRIALIGAEGEVFAGFSGGIRRSLQRLAKSYGLPPWVPGLRVKVEQVDLKEGHRMYRLDLVEELTDKTKSNGAAAKKPGQG